MPEVPPSDLGPFRETISALAKTIATGPRETIRPPTQSEDAPAAWNALRIGAEHFGQRLSMHQTIAEGGMGIVHLATQHTIGRPVAVKTLRDASPNPAAVRGILREAWITGSLEHPNVVPIYDVGIDESGAPFIVMKRIEGVPWASLMPDRAALLQRFSAEDPIEWNLRVLVSVCNAVHFAHARGILHRDLKPDNIMIGSFGEVYVLDWGIAVTLKEDPEGRLPHRSEATELAGTPAYMAPEMVRCEPENLSERTDVYLLGAILFEVFAGHPPHQGTTLEATLCSILAHDIDYPKSFPAEARAICEQALSLDPALRFTSVEQLKAALESYLRHRGSRKLVLEANQSLNQLLDIIKQNSGTEEASLAIFNLLGECRFGYRAALSAWPENASAQRNLDKALLAVVESELTFGNLQAASVLLREVSNPPTETTAKVEQALKARLEQEEKLRKIEEDQDLTRGGRTRSFIMGIFGIFWTCSPLVQWYLDYRGIPVTHGSIVGSSLIFLGFCAVFYLWARETLTSTDRNRRLALTLPMHLSLQGLINGTAWYAGFTPKQSLWFLIISWVMTQAHLALWVEPWFALSASVCAVSLALVANWPSLLYPLMAFDNIVFTGVLVLVWLPRSDFHRIQERRLAIRKNALDWFRKINQTRRPAEEDSLEK